jgi:hypothetical protein
VQTSTAATWSTLLGPAADRTSTASGRLTLTVPAVGALLMKADSTVFEAPVPKPVLAIAPDGLSNLWAATATVPGNAPVSIAFAIRRAGTSAWTRLDVDTSPPYRGFIDPAKVRNGTRLEVVAISRALDGSIAVSPVVKFRMHPNTG